MFHFQQNRLSFVIVRIRRVRDLHRIGPPCRKMEAREWRFRGAFVEGVTVLAALFSPYVFVIDSRIRLSATGQAIS